MTSNTKGDTAQYETRMEQAIDALKTKKYRSIRKAAIDFNIKRTTLNNRFNGRKSRRESHESLQNLSPAEEEELGRWISKLTATGFSPSHSLVREMSEAIRNRRLRAVNNENIELVEYPPLGRDWVRNFLNRHPQFKTVVGRTVDSVRIQGTSPEVLRKWFDAFEEEVVNDPDVLLENVYNMDESGFSIGTIKAGHVIIDSKAPNQFQAQPGRQEWVTVVECICADGTSIPPYVIFKGKDLNIKWIPDNIPQG